MKIIISAISLILLFSCTAINTSRHEETHFTKHYKESVFEVTEKGLFSVEMILKEHGLIMGINALDIIVHDKNDNDVAGAEIKVSPWMPGMGHGVLDEPVITERGGGLYSVEDIILTMGGHWELRIDVCHDGDVDRVVFDFPDVTSVIGHKHDIVKPGSDIDLSVQKFSVNRRFKVFYESLVLPVPLNAIHSWRVRVLTIDGSPVTGANISVDGDMPEHGHGLPTQPEVALETDPGTYLVEGVKFNMPGWWVIKFRIIKNEIEDEVLFNILTGY